jgi:TRAP-type mannitol/chloroaromatic compound transport system substrate-binding protein
MERRSFVQGAGLAGVLAAGMAPAVVHAQANLRWRLTSGFPKALDTIYGAAETFCQEGQGHDRRQVRDLRARRR